MAISFILFACFLKNLAFQPQIELTLTGNEEAFQFAEELLEPSGNKGILALDFKQILQQGPMVQLKFTMKTWTGTVENELMIPAQKATLNGIILDSIRTAGQSYVESFQHLELQHDKWRHLASEMMQHRIENPAVIEKYLASSDKAPRFVLFYHDDGKLTNQVAAVAVSLARRELHETEILIADCTHNMEECYKYNVKEFPALQCFKDGKLYADFDDERMLTLDVDGVKNWISRLLMPAFHQVNEDQVPYFREGIIRGWDGVVDSVHVLFIEDKKSRVYHDFTKLASQNHGVYTFGTMVHQDVEKWALHPAIITFKPLENEIKAFTLHTTMGYEEMRNYIDVASDPSLFDLTSPIEALKAFTRQVPVLVLFDPLCNSPSFDLAGLAAEDTEYRRTKARFGTVNGTNPFSLSLLASSGVKQFDRAQWVLIDVKESLSYVIPFNKETHTKLREFIADPSKLSQPRESTLSVEVIRNVILGEIFEDSHDEFKHNDYHEPGTLPKPPLHNEAHDEL
ncbi:unnamed protein product, partial [Mesorhabditis belari]|uniref:Thioredoxin domain-containing protein n=1 Tax=Mesorhabditis belari TaxID=2138241 RepID=A0AAF3F4I5_9BILA